MVRNPTGDTDPVHCGACTLAQNSLDDTIFHAKLDARRAEVAGFIV